MRHTAIVLASLLVTFAAFAERSPGAVTGLVQFEDAPLPGVSVRLVEAGSVLMETTTDIDGRYSFDVVPGGYYDLEVSLEGLLPQTREVHVNGNANALEPFSLEFDETTTITRYCGSPCGGDGQPSCDEYDANRALEKRALKDPESRARLREIYRETRFRGERVRIGAFLLAVTDDDEEYFLPLAERVDILLGFAEGPEGSLSEDDEDYVAWCALTGGDPSEELWRLHDETSALFSSLDLKAATYAHRALRVRDFGLRMYAIQYAGLTCEPSLLKAITDDFSELAEDHGHVAMAFALPCGDPVLNAMLQELDPEFVEREWPAAVEYRAAEFARLGVTRE